MNGGPFFAVAKKELAGVFQERTILLAVFIQVFVAGFSSLLVVGLSALVDPSAIPNYADPVLVTDEGSELIPFLLEDGFEVVAMGTREAAMEAFEQGGSDGAFFVTDDDDPATPVTIELFLPDGDMFATLTLVQVKESLESYERSLRDEVEHELRHEPLYLEANAEAGQYAFVYSLLIPLLVALPIILSGGLMADSITEEIQRKTLPILLVSPATVTHIVAGKLVANVMITPMLTIAWLGLLRVNGFLIPLDGAIWIMLLSTGLAFIAGLLACFVALSTRDRDRAQVIYAVVFFLAGGLSLLAPTSPVNAIALLAADSVHPGVYSVLVWTGALCLIGWLGLRFGLDRFSAHLASAQA